MVLQLWLSILLHTHATELNVDIPELFGQVITLIDAPRGQAPKLKRFLVLRLSLKS